jgi:hypothetical protein
VRHLEQFAEAQATWLEQISLKDRAAFLEEQKALDDAWTADMEALIDGQNTALQQVVMQAAASLRAQTRAMASRSTEATSPTVVVAPVPLGWVVPWDWIATGMLLGRAVTVALTTAAWFLVAEQ